MHALARPVVLVACLLGLASTGHAQPATDVAPDQPFQTVHLMAADPAQERALKAAVDDFNSEFARQGCATCAYRMSRRIVGSQSPFDVLLVADWPSRGEHLRIHGSPGFQAVEARRPVFATLQATQFYGRFVEVR